MANYKEYMHIERFGKSEVEGIELGECFVFPKIDGTNAVIWNENGVIKAGSRTRELTLEKDNAGFYRALLNDKQFDGVKKFLLESPNTILFGEFLVKHTISTYRENAWRKFYLFDMFQIMGDNSRYLSYPEYKVLCEMYGIEYIPCLAIVKNGTYENFTHYLTGNNYLIEDGKGTGEGIVLKNYEYRNKWGRQCFAKIITSEFKEKFHKEMGPNEIEHKMVEDEITEKYCTDAFIDKTKAKIINEVGEWSNKLIPRLIETCFHELIVEEMWNVIKEFKQPKIDFKTLRYFLVNKVKRNLGI